MPASLTFHLILVYLFNDRGDVYAGRAFAARRYLYRFGNIGTDLMPG